MAPRKARNFNGYIPKFEVSSVELHATFVSPRPTYLLLAPRRWDPCWVAAVHRSGEIKLALLSWFAAYARQNSPSARKTPQIRRFCVSRANFVSHKARYASCWAKNVSPTGAVIRLAAGGVWVFRTVCFERVVLSSPGCLWPGRMDDHEEVLEAHA